jgi:hypothetical protein
VAGGNNYMDTLPYRERKIPRFDVDMMRAMNDEATMGILEKGLCIDGRDEARKALGFLMQDAATRRMKDGDKATADKILQYIPTEKDITHFMLSFLGKEPLAAGGEENGPA